MPMRDPTVSSEDWPPSIPPGSLYKHIAPAYMAWVLSPGRPRGTYKLSISDGPRDTWEILDITQPSNECLQYGIPRGSDPELRQLAADCFGINRENIFFVPGGCSLANHFVIHTLLFTGGVAAIESPTYDPLIALIRSSKSANATIPLRVQRSAQADFQPDIQQFESLLRNEKPRLVVFTNPNNPTGRLLTVLPKLIEILHAHNVKIHNEDQKTYILVDEVHRWGFLNGPPSGTLSPYVISTSSPTKVCGLSGTRMGMIFGSPSIIGRINGFCQQSCVTSPSFMVDIWRQVLEQMPKIMEHVLARRERRLSIISKMFQEANISWSPPNQLATNFLIQLPQDVDDKKFCNALAQKLDTEVIPGYQLEMPGFVRLAFMMVDEDDLVIALERFCKFYNQAKEDPTTVDTPSRL